MPAVTGSAYWSRPVCWSRRTQKLSHARWWARAQVLCYLRLRVAPSRHKSICSEFEKRVVIFWFADSLSRIQRSLPNRVRYQPISHKNSKFSIVTNGAPLLDASLLFASWTPYDNKQIDSSKMQ